MRITAQAKQETEQRIIDAAVVLFRSQGFEATTTRDIARAAGIATGTLFNYFPTKEAIVTSLAQQALAKSLATFDASPRLGSPEESLFALVAHELRQLKPLRKFVRPVLETALSPLATGDNAAQSLKLAHLEAVAAIAIQHNLPEPPAAALHLYWTLYTGVLAFWAGDGSPKQEDTLALLDDSISMFAGWLRTQSPDENTRRR
jgi:AcrR family transcriptional regulator